MKLNGTVEEFEFKCSGCAKKSIDLKSSIPVVKATTRPRSSIRNFVALSFLVNGQYFKDYRKILGTLGLPITSVPLSRSGIRRSILLNGLHRSSKRSQTGVCKKQELKQLDVEINLHWTSSDSRPIFE